MRWNSPAPSGISADPPGNSADPPGEYEKEKKNATERLAFSFFIFAAQSSRSKTEFIGFAGRRARTEPGPGLYFPLFPTQSSRTKTEFIGFAGRRARTEPGPGPLFHFLPAQGSRSETEFIDFAGSRARTKPGPGPLFRFLSAQGSRSKTEFIDFAGRRARTNLPPALALQNNKPASGSNSLTMSLAEHAIRLPPGDTSRILRSCQPGWPSLACSFSSSS